MKLAYAKSFNVIGVDNTDKAKAFYADVLGLNLKGELWPGSQFIEIGDGQGFILYNDKGHKAGTGAVLTFHVTDIDTEVDKLVAAGVQIDTEDAAGQTDEKGVLRIRTEAIKLNVALFKDPASNIISLLQFL